MDYINKIQEELEFKIKFAFEIEFYLNKKLDMESDEDSYLARILYETNLRDIKLWEVTKEVAPAQFEVALQPQEFSKSIEELESLKNIIIKLSKDYKREVIFDAKPFGDLPGNGLHVHIGIYDKDNNNVLQRVNREDGIESDYLIWAVGGLCKTMIKNFKAFAPTENSKRRFTSDLNKIAEGTNILATYNVAPVNVSWGGNNRTTAIRIPTSTYDETTRHIEHRVAGADAYPKEVLEAISEGIYIGIKDKIIPPEKIYGNAFDQQYDFLEKFTL